VERVVEVGQAMGLSLNFRKCELISNPGSIIKNSTLQQLPTTPISEATLLGAPLFQGPALDQSWSKRCDDLVKAMNRLKLLYF